METLPAPPPLETHGEWLRAHQEAQRQTAEAHAAYQRAMAETHMAFLRTAETSFAGLSALLGASRSRPRRRRSPSSRREPSSCRPFLRHRLLRRLLSRR
jgi:hypothetical protein